MTLYDFGSNQSRLVGRQYVYLRQLWGQSWTLYPSIRCTEVTWCLSPSMPTATLVRDYGFLKPQGDVCYSVFAKLDPIGYYVKIVLETDINSTTGLWNTKTWYGIVSHQEDEHNGVVTAELVTAATGTQTFCCYGLEKLLDTETLFESWVNLGDTMPFTPQLPITFNAGGRPNRSEFVAEPNNSFVFEGRNLRDPSYPDRKAEWWSSYHIVDYLLGWAVPKESFATRTIRVPFKLPVADAIFISTLDQPVLEQEGHTILSLLYRLIDRRRLRSFYLTLDETSSPHDVLLKVVPLNASAIDTGIDGADVLLPNTNALSLSFDFSSNTSAILRQSRVAKYDRVIVRGARRTSTATFHVAATYLNAAWTGTDETAYEAAASGVTGYAGWDLPKKKQRNNEVRDSAKLSCVYSWFKLADAWTGLTTAPEAATTYVVFPGETADFATEQYLPEVTWLPYIPLYEHTDYSGTKIEAETVADPPILVYRIPQVWFKIPTDARWIDGDSIATLQESTGDAPTDGKNFRWSAYVRPQPDSRTLEVRVSGEQQHVIAETDFTALADDRDLGDFDYASKLMLITATLQENRYAEGRYPVDDAIGDSSSVDIQYGFVIYAGDGYRQDYVVPSTVLDVETDGTLITSTSGGYARDDTDLLKALARITYEWWATDRVVLTLTTAQLTSSIHLGDYLQSIGAVGSSHLQTVNTVISELRIIWPQLEGNQLSAPTMQFTTGAGELDPMTLTPREPKAARSKRKTR